ncbi:Uncharacterised protein [Mycobacteroides abscessus subsp. abscessus]|nr:Uncharacterised protein [Mycobacteroides abscessus subsp. abscessus]
MLLGEVVGLGRTGFDAAPQRVGEACLEGVGVGFDLAPVVLAELRRSLLALRPLLGLTPALLRLG